MNEFNVPGSGNTFTQLTFEHRPWSHDEARFVEETKLLVKMQLSYLADVHTDICELCLFLPFCLFYFSVLSFFYFLLWRFRRLDRACCCKSGFGVSVSIGSMLFRFRYASFLLEIEAHPAETHMHGKELLYAVALGFEHLALSSCSELTRPGHKRCTSSWTRRTRQRAAPCRSPRLRRCAGSAQTREPRSRSIGSLGYGGFCAVSVR